MTGIYSGALMCWVVLLRKGRLLTRTVPTLPVIAVLTSAVAVLAIDGFNSLFLDLGVWHPYQPHNTIRYFTGVGTGVALATLQSWLIGTSLWKIGRNTPAWDSVKPLIWIGPAALILYLALTFAPTWSYSVIAVLLMASAWITVTGLVLVIIVSSFRIEYRITSLAQLNLPLFVSTVVSLVLILSLAQGRFWLERTFGIPQDFITMAPISFAAILSR
jgi:hypothetical protein